jgi:RNA polymerase sigma-70 factor, ECF subfamily
MDLTNERIFDLLRQIGQGNEAAMREVYRSFSRKVYAYALNHIHDAGKAEEVVVDTMHEVWRHPDRFRGDSKFSTWLIGIARHKLLDAFRKAKPDYDELDESLPSEDQGAFDVLAEKQRREGVRHCMEKLSEDHRECLHLVFYEGMSLVEVATIQQCPENTVKTRLFHARQKIKNCLRLLLEREL